LAEKIGVFSGKIHVIYNAVDFFGTVPERAEPLSPIIVFSGRLIVWKGVQMLVELMPRLKEKYPDLIFKIIGDGPEKNKIKPADGAIFLGRMSEEETQKIMAHSTIFVLNTNYEGLPHSVLNALNVGLPVITTPVGGNPEVIQSEYNGLLAAYNDKEAWFKAITRLLDDRALRDKFSANGRQTLEKFKWSELVEKTIGVFKSI
jgi:glycosyltransferase involved in cell wall biosynthesis